MAPINEGLARAGSAARPGQISVEADVPENVTNPISTHEAIAGLTRDFAIEALRVTAVKSANAANNLEVGYEPGAEREIRIAIAHLQQVAATFHEMHATDAIITNPMKVPPFLALSEGRKPRPRKAPRARPKELVLHVAVPNVLRRHALPDWRWRHLPNGLARDARHAAKFRAMGVMPGWSDFQLISPYGSARFLKLKRLSEDLSDDQEAFRHWCTRQGVPYAVAQTLSGVMAAFSSWGYLRPRAPR